MDLVMEQANQIWSFETESSAAINRNGRRGLARLARACREKFQYGIVLCAGESIFPLPNKRMLSVPLSELWCR